MGGVLGIFETCRLHRKRETSPDAAPTPREAEPEQEEHEPNDNHTETKKGSFKEKIKKRLFSGSQVKDEASTSAATVTSEKEGKDLAIANGDADQKDIETSDAKAEDHGDNEVFAQDKASILRKKQPTSPPHEVPQKGFLVNPRLAHLQGGNVRKPQSTAFEHIGVSGGKPGSDDEEEPISPPPEGGVLLPGIADLRKRFTAQGTEVKVRRLSSKDDTFASVPRNSALLKRFERAPPPKRSQARISRMQLRQRANEEDLFGAGAWNNNNSSQQNSNHDSDEGAPSDHSEDSHVSSNDKSDLPDSQPETKICESKATISLQQALPGKHDLLRKNLEAAEKERPRSFTPGGIQILPNSSELLRKLPKRTEEKATDSNKLTPDSSQTSNRKSVPVFSSKGERVPGEGTSSADRDIMDHAQVHSDIDLTTVTTNSQEPPPADSSSPDSPGASSKPYHEMVSRRRGWFLRQSHGHRSACLASFDLDDDDIDDDDENLPSALKQQSEDDTQVEQAKTSNDKEPQKTIEDSSPSVVDVKTDQESSDA